MLQSVGPARGVAVAEPLEGVSEVLALVCLTPSESKRLIAKAVAALPAVQKAYREGWLVIARGTTNAFVAEEILGINVSKYNYCAGIVYGGSITVVPRDERMMPFVFHQGQSMDLSTNEAVRNFSADDVFIKGANAVDLQGNAGVFVAGDDGGTIGGALGSLQARGSHLIVAVGLEKLIPSVPEAARKCGIHRFKYALTDSCGLVPLVTAEVITEIQAIALLTGAQTTHVASGGVGGGEGAVSLAVEGTDDQVRRAWELVQSIKGEPPVIRA